MTNPIYLDNAATTWPKPESVGKAMMQYLELFGGSPGRSGHRFAIEAARGIFETREKIAQLFSLHSSDRVIFTANATMAVNIALKGIVQKGDHIIISPLEHNAVWRTVHFLKESGVINYDIAPATHDGVIDVAATKMLIRKETRLIVCIHGSNVTGAIQDIASLGALCHEHDILFMVDAAQTAGLVPIDMLKMQIGILAFTGHKKMYGPMGTGGLCISERVDPRTLIHGGTGSKSEDAAHPDFFPDRLEAGTPNTVGLFGLNAGLGYVLEHQPLQLWEKSLLLANHFSDACNSMKGITVYTPTGMHLPNVSITLHNILPGEAAAILDKEFGIMVRPGLHCAPLAHRTLGTIHGGTIRFSFGCFNTMSHTEAAITALHNISKR